MNATMQHTFQELSTWGNNAGDGEHSIDIQDSSYPNGFWACHFDMWLLFC